MQILCFFVYVGVLNQQKFNILFVDMIHPATATGADMTGVEPTKWHPKTPHLPLH